jgi:hypothetical protein
MAFESNRRTVRIKRGAPDGQLLAEVSYRSVDEVHGRLRPTRQVAVTGVPPGAVVNDWPVRWTDGMRVLDGTGRIELLPGYGLLLGIERGAPLWWIDGADLADAFDRALVERRAIAIDDPGHVRARKVTCPSHHPHRRWSR